MGARARAGAPSLSLPQRGRGLSECHLRPPPPPPGPQSILQRSPEGERLKGRFPRGGEARRGGRFANRPYGKERGALGPEEVEDEAVEGVRGLGVDHVADAGDDGLAGVGGAALDHVGEGVEEFDVALPDDG